MKTRPQKIALVMLIVLPVLMASIYACADKKKPAVVDSALTLDELRIVQGQQRKRAEWSNAINTVIAALDEAFARDDKDVTDRIRATHNMVEGDTWEANGAIHRKKDEPKPAPVVPHPRASIQPLTSAPAAMPPPPPPPPKVK